MKLLTNTSNNMKTKNKIQFDELDIKCINQMPLILDAISSTGNKITRVISPFRSELKEFIIPYLKSGWRFSEKSSNLEITPLTSENKTMDIKILEEYFQIESTMEFSKMSGKKELNFFWICYGYYCFRDNETDVEGSNYFYFNINRTKLKTYGGVVNNLKFYDQIKRKIQGDEIEVEVYHPENGDDMEQIELSISNFSVDKIQEGFDVFKRSILTPFLKSIK